MIIAKITALSFVVLLFVSFLAWGGNGAVNYLASFVAFCAVAASSFAGYRRIVLSSRDIAVENDEGDDEGEQKQPSKISLLTKTYKGWLFPLRLISYGFFVLVFLYFANNNLLNIFAFLLGIAVLPISVLIYIYFFRREF